MTTTALVVTTLVIVLSVYDLAAVVIGKIQGKGIKFSVSRFMQWIPHNAIFFVCGCFYVMGHFWGFMNCPDCPKCEECQVCEPSPDHSGLDREDMKVK